MHRVAGPRRETAATGIPGREDIGRQNFMGAKKAREAQKKGGVRNTPAAKKNMTNFRKLQKMPGFCFIADRTRVLGAIRPVKCHTACELRPVGRQGRRGASPPEIFTPKLSQAIWI